MKLPALFLQVHGDSIFNTWIKCGQPPFVKVIPRKPPGFISSPSSRVTVVTLRCWNDRGVMRTEAASPIDLKVVQAWAARYADMSLDDFNWVPELGAVDEAL